MFVGDVPITRARVAKALGVHIDQWDKYTCITLVLLVWNRLQKLQNRAARVIMGRKNEHGQSDISLNELGSKYFKECKSQFVTRLM